MKSFLPRSAVLLQKSQTLLKLPCPTSELGESRTCVSHAVLVQSGASIRCPPAPKLPIGPIATQHRSAQQRELHR